MDKTRAKDGKLYIEIDTVIEIPIELVPITAPGQRNSAVKVRKLASNTAASNSSQI